jgi:hypothetical protein
MTEDRHNRDNLLIQLRTGASLGKRIKALSRRKQITTNEAARQLLLLAVLGLTKDDFEVLEQLDEGTVEDFSAACTAVLAAVDVFERLTAKPGEAPVTPEQRSDFLRSWVVDFTRKHAPEAEDAAAGPAAQPMQAAKKKGGKEAAPTEVYRRVEQVTPGGNVTEKKEE